VKKLNIKRLLKNPKYILYYIDQKLKIRIKDETYLKLRYELMMNKKLNLNNPRTFNEKLQWLKLYDRNPNYTKMVDKHEVKQYIENIIGKEYIIPTLGIYDKFEDINFEELPNQFVLKCTHDSGGVVICKDKENFDYCNAKKKLNNSLKNNYYYSAREWPYKNIKPRIIAEEYMEDKNSGELEDYKFMCFDGKVKCSFTCTERYSKDGLKVTFFDLDWKKMPFERHYPASDKEIKKPLNYECMIKLSEKLSKDIPFVRVDFYEVNGRIYFGELTFFPGSGYEEFEPEEWDEKLGNMLELPRKRIEEKYE